VSVSVAVPSTRDAAASVEVFCFSFLFVENEKKLVIMVLFMKPVVWIEKDMNERQDSKVDDDDDDDDEVDVPFSSANLQWHIRTRYYGKLRPMP
jgi:hypothetical protein